MRATTRHARRAAPLRTRAVAAAAVLALLGAACGDGDADTDTDTDAPADPADDADGDADGDAAAGEVADNPDEGVTSDAIRIGWMGDVTGPTASAQTLNLRGLEAYADMINAEGGILGRDLEVVVRDDEYSAETGVANFQALVNDDRVIAINNVGGAHIIEAVQGDAERIGIPMVSLAQTQVTGFDNEWLFHNLASYADMADVAVARMIDEVGSADELRAAVVQLEVPSGDEWNAYIERGLEDAGATYLGRQTISPGQSDAGALITNLQQLVDQEGLNYVALHGAPADGLLVVNSLAAAGLEIPIVGITGIASLNVFQEGDRSQLDLTEGIHSFVTYADDTEGGEEIRAFIDGEGSAYADDAAHINFTHGWLGGMIFHQALERAAETGEVSRASLQEALQGPFDVKGLTCDLDWSEQNHTPCAAPFTSTDGEAMELVGSFEEWAEHIDEDYELG
jgi:branched-chain amino acid transport system substrate-binding protein